MNLYVKILLKCVFLQWSIFTAAVLSAFNYILIVLVDHMIIQHVIFLTILIPRMNSSRQ